METNTMNSLTPVNTELIKIGAGAWDRGAFHRCVALARELVDLGLWDNARLLWVHHPYDVYLSFMFSVGGKDNLIFSMKDDGLHVYHKWDDADIPAPAPTPPQQPNGLINAMVEASIEIQENAYTLAMQETQPAQRVSVYLNNCLPGQFKASELGAKLGVSAATVRKVAQVHYGLKSEKGWFLWTKANPPAPASTPQSDDTTNEGEIFYYEADQPCPVCGEYCKRSPSDCEEFGYDADDYEEDGFAVCSHCGERYCTCDDYDADGELMELAKATITANEAAQPDDTTAPYIDYLPEDFADYIAWALAPQLANQHAINHLFAEVL